MRGSMRKPAIKLKQRFISNDTGRFQIFGNIVQIDRANRLLAGSAVIVINKHLLFGKRIFFKRNGRLYRVFIQRKNIRSCKPANASQYDTDAENKCKIDHAAKATGLPIPPLPNRRFITI